MGWPGLGIGWGGRGQFWTLARVNMVGLGMVCYWHVLGYAWVCAGIGMVWAWRELGCSAHVLGMICAVHGLGMDWVRYRLVCPSAG